MAQGPIRPGTSPKSPPTLPTPTRATCSAKCVKGKRVSWACPPCTSARPHHCCTCAGTPYRVGTARGAHHFLIHSPSLPLPFPLHLGARASRRRCRSTAAAPLLLRRCCCAPMCATAGQARVAHKRRWGHLCLAGRRCAAWCSPCRSRPWPAQLLLEKDLVLKYETTQGSRCEPQTQMNSVCGLLRDS